MVNILLRLILICVATFMCVSNCHFTKTIHPSFAVASSFAGTALMRQLIAFMSVCKSALLSRKVCASLPCYNRWFGQRTIAPRLFDFVYSFSLDCLSQSVVPLVCKFCEQAVQLEDHTLPSVARDFGKYCCNMSSEL